VCIEKRSIQEMCPSGCWWLTPLILATQEGCSLKPGRQMVPETILKKPFTKKGLVSGSRDRPEFKPQYHKKKKKEEEREKERKKERKKNVP
jgi:hypothetical protein